MEGSPMGGGIGSKLYAVGGSISRVVNGKPTRVPTSQMVGLCPNYQEMGCGGCRYNADGVVERLEKGDISGAHRLFPLTSDSIGSSGINYDLVAPNV